MVKYWCGSMRGGSKHAGKIITLGGGAYRRETETETEAEVVVRRKV